MSTFTNKELYMMNGGNKLYIHKDGFGDVYSATQSEEAMWAKEIVASSLVRLDTEDNATVLKSIIENLRFHHYPDMEALLLTKLKEAGPGKQIVFATALWSLCSYEKAFDIIYQNLVQYGNDCLNTAFLSLGEFKNNEAAKKLLIACLEGDDDDVLFAKAYMTINIWAYSGMPALRSDNLLEMLKLENKNESTFKNAVEQLKRIFF